jgi:hypothetical protein
VNLLRFTGRDRKLKKVNLFKGANPIDTEKVSHLLDEDVQGIDEAAYRVGDRDAGFKASTNEAVGCPPRPIESAVKISLCYVYALVKVLVLAALNSE